MPGSQRCGKKNRQAPAVSGTGDREGLSHAGGRGQGRTWAGKAAGQYCACGFLAFVRRWPGRQSAKNRLPVQGGRACPGLACLSSRTVIASPGGGCQADGTGPVTGNTAGRSVPVSGGASRRRQASARLDPAGRPVGDIYIILILLAKIKKMGKIEKKACQCGANPVDKFPRRSGGIGRHARFRV